MTVVRAAAVQISPALYSREGTFDKVVQKIAELGRRGVQFATFPEAVVPYYPYFSFLQSPFEIGPEHLRLIDQAVTIPSPATHAIGEAARQSEMVVSIGVNERDGGTLFNAQLLFDADGSMRQRRRKISATYHERIIWGQGDGSGLRAVVSAVGRNRTVGVLGALQPAGPVRPDRRRRADPLRYVARFVRRRAVSPSRPRSASATTHSSRVLSS
jgi:aliphatic nitrilase